MTVAKTTTAKPGPRAKKAPVVKAAPTSMAEAVPEPVIEAAVKPAVETAKDVEAVVKDSAVAIADTAVEAAEVIEAAPSPAVESDTVLAEATLAAVDEGSDTMATVEFGADKAQAVFGEMQARFKAAWDKSSKVGEELVEFTKGNVEAVVASAKVAAKYGEEIGQETADYGKKSFESAMAQFRSLASAKSPTELFQLQSDFAKSSFDSAVAEASKVSEKMLKIAGDVAQPISSRYAVAAEKIKTTTF